MRESSLSLSPYNHTDAPFEKDVVTNAREMENISGHS